MRSDPKTGEFINYGPQGPGRDVVKEGIYHIAADENYVYTTIGRKTVLSLLVPQADPEADAASETEMAGARGPDSSA